ncbi:2-methylcitrate dehydratase, 2-methylcitrate dehydratase [Burkholderia sp. 8Y]|uniref:MmgE/PrpD family protein n=1 Tax=Burkholderia sp. 8Y TaxID=2653133 RepID=UPI0012F3064F|nr:MmgE/PrpD family protein [Burkholderia sp. 8Y]VXB40388.1 2-methylcitrate dehydratase, 2-methylcitrate dehydratase [Burkholderia sp. 8Y]
MVTTAGETQEEPSMTEQLAAFVGRMHIGDLGDAALDRLKRSIVDALGCAIGAIGQPTILKVRRLVTEFGGPPLVTLIGGGCSAPDRAALYNGCLVRYLDFMDNTAIRGEVCHPSDNLAALLAAGEYADATGASFLAALGIAYQVQTRLLDIPTMRAGINYTTPLSFSVAAGASSLLALDEWRCAQALALAGVGAVSLAAIQAEPVSEWKGLASGEAASRALANTFLARNGITGPMGVFEGPMGLFHLAGAQPPLDWSRERLDVPLRVSIKKHNAEFQSQSAVDLAIRLRDAHGIDAAKIAQVNVEVSDGAYQVLGGGAYGPKDQCWIKEQADHNLKYLIAVALIDGEVWPAQFAEERIRRDDVQSLLRRVNVSPNDHYTKRIPDEMPASMQIVMTDGAIIGGEQAEYEGFHTHSMDWSAVDVKFERLTADALDAGRSIAIRQAVRQLETIRLRELTELLAW